MPACIGIQAAAKPAPAQPKAASSAPKLTCQVVDGKFTDYRWEGGRWTLSNFENKAGNMDWDAVQLFLHQDSAFERKMQNGPSIGFILCDRPALITTLQIPQKFPKYFKNLVAPAAAYLTHMELRFSAEPALGILVSLKCRASHPETWMLFPQQCICSAQTSYMFHNPSTRPEVPFSAGHMSRSLQCLKTSIALNSLLS